jgi:hypothetical protein
MTIAGVGPCKLFQAAKIPKHWNGQPLCPYCFCKKLS